MALSKTQRNKWRDTVKTMAASSGVDAWVLRDVTPDAPVLHVCAGKIREYPFRGLGPNDVTLDIDPDTQPDIVHDARTTLPLRQSGESDTVHPWPAILIDRPYSVEDAEHYKAGSLVLPPINALLKNALNSVPVGHRVGVLDYVWPHPGKAGLEVAVVGVVTGRNNRIRVFSVFERVA